MVALPDGMVESILTTMLVRREVERLSERAKMYRI
jgi:hypothetical protein